MGKAINFILCQLPDKSCIIRHTLGVNEEISQKPVFHNLICIFMRQFCSSPATKFPAAQGLPTKLQKTSFSYGKSCQHLQDM